MIFDEMARDDIVRQLESQGWTGDRARLDNMLTEGCRTTSIRAFTEKVGHLSSNPEAAQAFNALVADYKGAFYSYEYAGRIGPNLQLWGGKGKYESAVCHIDSRVLVLEQSDSERDEKKVLRFGVRK